VVAATKGIKGMRPGKSEIAIMVRVPVAGEVKTRLVPALGGEGACCLYRAMVEDILDQAKATGLPIHLFYTGGGAEQLPLAWRETAHRLTEQQGADLGLRMAHAFATCFQEAAQVVLIGSDIPDMNTEMLLEAVQSLAEKDVVLTPAMDGGYCLLALNRGVAVPGIFTDMPWSTDQVLSLTRQRLKDQGLRGCLLSPVRDIDTAEDLHTYQQAPNPLALHTNRVLSLLIGSP